MGTWAEQIAPEPLKPVPNCRYIVRKGQTPDFEGRSNILPWQEALAARSDRWAPLIDAQGNFMTELPPMPRQGSTVAMSPHLSERKLEEEKVKASTEAMREIQVFQVFQALEDDDFKPNGLPKVDVVRERTGFDDLTGTDIKKLWHEYLEAQK